MFISVLSVFAFLVGIAFMLMTVVDQRDKTEVYEKGSSKVALGLTAAQAQEAFGDASATGGWYMPSYQVETQIGPSRDTEDVKDEADNLIKSRVSRDEFVLITTFFQTDDDVINLIEWMEDVDNAVKLRYPMPTQDVDTDGEQWLFMYNVNVRRQDWRITAANAQDRTLEVEFFGTLDANGNLKDIVTLPTDQSDSQWDDFADFKDTALP